MSRHARPWAPLTVLILIGALLAVLIPAASALAAAGTRADHHRSHHAHHCQARRAFVHRHTRRHHGRRSACTVIAHSAGRSQRPRPIARRADGNSFGSDIFGIAASSYLQNENGTPAMAQDLNLFQNAGAGWVRIDINWAQIQAGGPDSYDWTNIDAAVQGAESRGMHVLGTIIYSPNWAVPAGQDGTYSPNPTLYAAFAGKAAAHYSALGVQDFEIWNEPNSVGSWTPKPNVAAYTTLLKDADTSIKAADPSATVITGGLAPAASDGTNISPTDFLQGIYANGGKGSFDAVGMHPYCNPDLPGAPDAWSAWYQMYGTPVSLRSIMIANGDSNLKIWGTEFGTPSSGLAGVSDAFQAETITRAYQLWSTYSWAGPLFFYQGRDNANDPSDAYDNYGFANVNFSVKPSFYAYRSAASSL